MKTLQWAAAALAVGALALPARAETATTNDWWNVTFEPGSFQTGFGELTVGELGTLTNDETKSECVQPYASGVWTMIDGDESYVTNEFNPTNLPAGEFGRDYCIKLDTQGNDLTWTPTGAVDKLSYLVDADLYLVGSDSAPDASDFDADSDVQAAIYLKNETNEETGETTNSVLCVYVEDADTGKSYWQELKGVKLDDNSWAHVQVVVDHSGKNPMVSVFVNGTQMSARDGNALSWLTANKVTAVSTGKVNSVAFRGTGAVDNFAGKSLEKTSSSYNFTAEVYMNGTLVAQGDEGNVTRVVNAMEGVEQFAPFAGFSFHDLVVDVDEFDNITINLTYALTKIVLVNFAEGTTETFNYGYENYVIVPDKTSPYIVFDVDKESGAYSGPFDISAPTLGATKDDTIVRIYFEDIPAEGDFKLTATQNIGTAPADQKFNTNTLAVAETTFSFDQALTDGGKSYILSTIEVGETPAGITAAPAGSKVVVTVPLNDQIAEGVYNVAAATYVEGSLADGEALQGSREGNVYTYTKYTPPVAIIIAGDVTNKFDSLRGAITNATPGDTIYLLRDDAVSFTAENPILDIDFEVTIDGGSNTLYGLSAFAGEGYNEVRIGGSGNVTIKDLAFSEFGDTAPLSGASMPICTRSTYTGMLTLDGVTIDKFNRQAVLLCGGEFFVTNCTITGCAGSGKTSYFQSAFENYFAAGTIVDTTVTGIGALDAGTNGEGDPWAAAVFTVNPSGNGSYTVLSGDYEGQFIVAANLNSAGSVILSNGTFVATAPKTNEVEGVQTPVSAFLLEGNVAVTVAGGWYDREPEEGFIADGMSAVNYGAAAPTAAAPWTVEGAKVTVTWVITETSSNMVQVAVGSQVSAYEGEDVVNGTKKFKFWSTDGTTEASFPVTAEGNLTFFAVWEDAAVDPVAVNPGTSLTDADKAKGDLPIEVTADGFVVKFRSSQPGIVYQLVAAGTCDLTEDQWKGVAASGNAVPVEGASKTSSAATSETNTELITLTAPMTDNVKFFKIRASLPAGN